MLREPSTSSTASGGRTFPIPSAGDILHAVEALASGRQLFSADQVAHLLALAYDSGRTATYLDDLARLHGTWLDNATARRTYEQRVADELAEMDRAGRDRAAREGRPYRIYPGGPVDWETGRPLRRSTSFTNSENGTTPSGTGRDVTRGWAA